jgi:hypothetical protein
MHEDKTLANVPRNRHDTVCHECGRARISNGENESRCSEVFRKETALKKMKLVISDNRKMECISFFVAADLDLGEIEDFAASKDSNFEGCPTQATVESHRLPIGEGSFVGDAILPVDPRG